MGNVVKIIMEYFSCVAENIFSTASAISVEFSLLKSTDICTSTLFRYICRGCRSTEGRYTCALNQLFHIPTIL